MSNVPESICGSCGHPNSKHNVVTGDPKLLGCSVGPEPGTHCPCARAVESIRPAGFGAALEGVATRLAESRPLYANVGYVETLAAEPAPSKIDPAHYNAHDVQPWDAIRAWGLDFDLGSAVKYVARAGKKPGESKLDDLLKARAFLEHAIEHEQLHAPIAGSVEVRDPEDECAICSHLRGEHVRAAGQHVARCHHDGCPCRAFVRLHREHAPHV